MSRSQFEFARSYGEQYWLFVVEHAADDARARIIKIRGTAVKAGTFTLDHCWIAVAEGSQAQRLLLPRSRWMWRCILTKLWRSKLKRRERRLANDQQLRNIS